MATMQRSHRMPWTRLQQMLDSLPTHTHAEVAAACGQRVLDVDATPPNGLKRTFRAVRGQTAILLAVRRRYATLCYDNGRCWNAAIEDVLLPSSTQFDDVRKSLAAYFKHYAEL